ncbi:hypothetical protein [Microbacterium xanthum]|uniref:hypothetical protein n=1 Tax=Microbacterium xanthum TaxID=3079794 RepID=UPI002AD5AE02|nr:hypothetical protein [Microbacterium sp. KSW-48]MDZ8171823.1 hypothetical protein [Microbacterium sp. KSW-48]
MRHATVDELSGLLRSRAALIETGMSDRSIGRAVETGVLHRVRRGWYIDGSTWASLWAESRHRALVLAVEHESRGATVIFCGVSAAVMHGLPLYRMAPRRAHVLAASSSRHSVHDVLRHEAALTESEIRVVDGVLCTDLARTVYDVVRSVPAEAAIAVADAALSRIGGDPRRFDDSAAGEFAARLAARAQAVGPRGIRQARRIIDLADGRAQLPLESVSRLQLHRLGFERPELQVPVPAPDGGTYFVDIGMRGLRAFGECDGKAKYIDEAQRSGRTLEQVLLDEKAREDWIRGTTQWRLARWGDEHAVTPLALGARLAHFGIRAP